jgi:predicted PurR-regulated permease PerM
MGLVRFLLIVLAAAVLVAPFAAHAEQLNFPLKAYTDEELAKVREWEKTWAGKKIDKSNVDQIKEYLPDSYAGVYAKP